MSWSSMWITPLLLVSACGGTFKSGSQGPGTAGTAAGGAESGAGGSVATGGTSGDSSTAGSVSSSGASAAGRSSGGANAGGASGGAGHGGVTSSAGEGGGKGVREPTQHRPAATACGTRPTPMPAPGSAGSASSAPLPITLCMTNGDCTAGPNGRCIPSRIGMTCSYDACFADADCAPGAVCQCGTANGAGNHCSQPGCQVDADCPSSWCSPTFGACGNYSGVVSYACHTAKDECVDDADCAGAAIGLGAYCMYDPLVARWTCSTSQCAG